MTFIIRITLALLVTLIVGCAPRGETKTLDEIFQIAKSRYDAAVVSSKVTEVTRSNLVTLIKDLDSFQTSSADQTRKLAGQIYSQLDSLISTAGYTTRPALSELAKTYQGLNLPDQRQTLSSVTEHKESSDDWMLDESSRKLVVARTFTALAQELETTAFQVMPKGVS